MIEFKQVSKKYGDFLALQDFSLQIREGEMMVLLGPSGCGKSTVLKLSNALIAPTEGEILIENRNIGEIKPYLLRRQIGYVIQNIGLFPHYSVSKNIAVVPSLLQWPRQKIESRIDELLELVGLDERYKAKMPDQLSGGESQRIGVARALAADPKILLMDEPFGSLDPINRDRLQREFCRIQKKLKKTVIFVTHDVEEAIRMADRIAIMRNGRLVDCAAPVEFASTGKHADPFITEFLGSEYALKLLIRFSVRDALAAGEAQMQAAESILPTIDSEASLSSALALMSSQGVTMVKATDSDSQKFIGMLTIEQIFAVLKNAQYD